MKEKIAFVLRLVDPNGTTISILSLTTKDRPAPNKGDTIQINPHLPSSKVEGRIYFLETKHWEIDLAPIIYTTEIEKVLQKINWIKEK